MSGQRPFGGGSLAEIAAAILQQEPPAISGTEATPVLRGVLRRCLERRPEERFQSARDVAFALDIAEATHAGVVAARRSWPTLVAMAALAALCVALALLLVTERGPAARVRRLALTFDASAPLDPADYSGVPFALFPDGMRLVFGTSTSDRHFAPLAVRDLASGETTLLPGTVGASDPFVSPDGEWVGFHASGSIRRVPAGGGAPITLCEAPNLAGGMGAPGGSIVFAPRGTGLMRVPREGGPPQPATSLAPGEQEHLWP